MEKFQAFDPLETKYILNSEAANKAIKREINNILNSYVGWYDPFCELIQNALDSIEEREKNETADYTPTIWITISIKDNYLTVTDNGTGLDEEKFKSFLAPNFSFKSGKTRGHKGVGATYIAYGFNYLQICTKSEDFSAVGKMINARKWLNDDNPAGNPKVRVDDDGSIDNNFESLDKGVSIHLKFDQTTHPKNLSWIKADSADAWFKILSVKTGLGAFFPNPKVLVNLTVVKKDGKIDSLQKQGIEYLWPQKIVRKPASYEKITQKRDELYQRGKDPSKLPSSLTQLDLFYGSWGTAELKKNLTLDEDELEICSKFSPSVYFGYAYSVNIWNQFNKELNIRKNSKVLHGGIQLAANNMPQGEVIQIPLQRNTGRQNQVHVVFHFENCSADLGRKGFQSELVDFSKEVARKMVDIPLQKLKYCLKTNTGVKPDLFREQQVEDWKEEMANYEKENPLNLISEHFFLPLKKISITSVPSREQDVISLFNQLLAGGVLRGIRIMATNERFTYDGLYKIIIEEPTENHIYDEKSNPLGILEENIDAAFNQLPFISKPKILEYKYSLDGLIENLQDGTKNSNDIGLVVVWETGDLYKESYKVTSLLDEDNLSFRQYHGLTHIMTNTTTGQREMDLIVLKELIEFLNDPEETRKRQIEKYED